MGRKPQGRKHMKHRTKLLSAGVIALPLAACRLVRSRGGHRHHPTPGTEPAGSAAAPSASANRSTRSRCACSGRSRRSSPATSRPATTGIYEQYCLDVEIIETGVDIVPQTGPRRRQRRLRPRLGAQGAGDARSRRRHRQHRPDLPALRHVAGVLRRRRHRQPGGLRGQEHRQLGLRQRVRDLRRPRPGRPRSGERRHASCSSSSTWSACSTARSTPPRR